MSVNNSFVLPDDLLSEKDDLDSLPESDDTSILDIEAEEAAQEEWERNLEQMQMLLGCVIVPWIGKFLGRKFAIYSWSRYMEWLHNVEIQWGTKRQTKTSKASMKL
ncbi:hypothetical protein HOO65_030333 [Ceratocystis lukuohia]|uniref:Uncharacterized protein n=2 Tax=Ceratocystis TaxID=5157 RepID=A0A0F8DMX3_CERFI|nr:putative protein tam7 [Ceratocystis platani]